MSDYYFRLYGFAKELAYDLTEDTEGRRLTVSFKDPIGSNYPWLYLGFLVSGVLHLSDIHHIEERTKAFIVANGGSLEDIAINVPGGGVQIKLTYRDGHNYATGG